MCWMLMCWQCKWIWRKNAQNLYFPDANSHWSANSHHTVQWKVHHTKNSGLSNQMISKKSVFHSEMNAFIGGPKSIAKTSLHELSWNKIHTRQKSSSESSTTGARPDSHNWWRWIKNLLHSPKWKSTLCLKINWGAFIVERESVHSRCCCNAWQARCGRYLDAIS